MNKQERASKILAQNPKAEKVFFTSDGMPFVNEHACKNHAKSLADKGIESFGRGTAQDAPDDAEKTFAETLQSKTVAELKAAAAELKIDFDARANKQTLIDLILAQAEASKPKTEAA